MRRIQFPGFGNAPITNEARSISGVVSKYGNPKMRGAVFSYGGFMPTNHIGGVSLSVFRHHSVQPQASELFV